MGGYTELIIGQAIIATFGLLTTLISGFAYYRMGKIKKQNKEQAAFKARENVIMFKSFDSIGDLAELTARCLKTGGRINGELDAAIQRRNESEQARKDFLFDVNAASKNW